MCTGESSQQAQHRAILALLFLVPAPIVGTAVGMVLYPGPVGSAVYGLSKLWMWVLPALWWLAVDKAKPGWSKPDKGGFAVAAGLGLAIGAVIVAAYFLVGSYMIDAEQVRQVAAGNQLTSLPRYLALCAYLILVNSVMEEYVYRWFIFRKFESLLPSWAAVFAAAACFTAHHVIALVAQLGWFAGCLCSLGVFIGGVVWSWLYLRYRSIWPGYLSHAIVDVVVLAIGYVLIFGAT